LLQVVNGGASITPNLTRKIILKFELLQTAPLQHNEAKEQPSARVKQVLKLVAAGSTSTEIDAHLRINGETIHTHLKNMYGNRNVRRR
jgi:DNA-binding NarL/FixJ family response regulator